MKKKELSLLILIVTSLMLSYTVLIPRINCNPLPAPEDHFVGGIVSNRSVSLNLLNADVLFNIDSTDFSNNIGIDFSGNYTIFNPDKKINITLYAPFSLEIDVVSSNCLVQINDTMIPFEILYIYELDYNVSTYIEDYLSSPGSMFITALIICNLTISENSTNTIKYQFSGMMPKRSNDFSISYDLGTARAWEGDLNEYVEFKVIGKIPDGYREYTNGTFEDRCEITDINNGKVYTWEWNNEKTNILQVGIIYKAKLFSFEFIILIIVLVGVSAIIGITITIIMVRRKRKIQKEIYSQRELA
ncbi:MAG: hypothetical protein ACFE9P_01925 [Candidatus Hermodarchaeota archaeon]